MNKLEAIEKSKTFRKGLDDILQGMKSFRTQLSEELRSNPQLDKELLNGSETIAQHTLSIRDLESAIMRQGMTLKNIGNPNPYPVSKLDPVSLAGDLYRAYTATTGGKSAVTGNELPTWEQIVEKATAGDEQMKQVMDGWVASAGVHPAMHRVEPTSDGLKL